MRGRPGVHRGQDLLARKGGPAVFLGRWLALGPGARARAGRDEWHALPDVPRFNVAGGIVWGTTFVLIGYGAGTSYTAVAKTVGTYSLGILAAIVVGVVVYVVIRRRRDRQHRRWGERWRRGEDAP